MHANQLKTERRASKWSDLQGRRGGGGLNVTCFSRSTISGKQQLDMQRHRQTARQTKRQRRSGRGGDSGTNKQTNIGQQHETRHTVHSAACREWGGTVDMSLPLAPLSYYATAPAPTSFTRILHSYISQTFRNIFVLLTQSRFIHFYSLPWAEGGWGVTGGLNMFGAQYV